VDPAALSPLLSVISWIAMTMAGAVGTSDDAFDESVLAETKWGHAKDCVRSSGDRTARSRGDVVMRPGDSCDSLLRAVSSR